MSFMEGFANALSSNMEDKRKRKRDTEDDVFRANYSTYLSNLKEQRDQSQKETQLFGKAKYLADRYGYRDPNAVKSIHQYLVSGGTEDDFRKDADTGTFSFESAAPDGPQGVANEMSSSGLADTADTNEDQYVPKVETGRSPLAVATMPVREANENASQERIVKRIADTTGTDEQSIRETMFGKSKQDLSPMVKMTYKPNSAQELKWIEDLPNDPKQLAIIEAKYDAMGDTKKADKIREITLGLTKDNNQTDAKGFMFYEDPKTGENIQVRGKTEKGLFYKRKADGSYEDQGTPTGKLNGQMIAENDNLELDDYKEIFKSVDPFEQMKVSTLSNVKDSMEAAQIVAANPAAVTKTAAVVSSLQGLTNEFDALNQMISQVTSNTNSTVEERANVVSSAIDQMKGFTERLDTSSLNDGERRLMRLQMNMVYSQLKLYGESGRSVSNFDIKNQMALVFDARPDNFEKHLQQQVKSNLGILETNRRSLMNSRGPLIAQSATHAYMADSAEQQIVRLGGSDPSLVQFLQETGNLDETNYRHDPVEEEHPIAAAEGGDTSGYTLVGKTPQGQEVYQDAEGNKFIKE